MNTLFCNKLNLTERQVETCTHSVNLAKTLGQQVISIVKTVNCIRKKIPREIKKMKEEIYVAKIFKHDGGTLTVCQAKTKKRFVA